MKPLDKLKELAKAATPGPWLKGSWGGRCRMDHAHSRETCDYNFKLDESVSCVSLEGNRTLIGWDENGPVLSSRNASFIAAANPDTILRLLEAIEILDSELENGCCCPGEMYWTGPKAGEPILCDGCEARQKVKEILK